MHFACDNTGCTLTGRLQENAYFMCSRGDAHLLHSVLIRKDELEFQINSILLADLNSPDLLCMSKLC